MKNLNFFTLAFKGILVLTSLCLVGCATDLPIKAARDTSIITGVPNESINSEVNSPEPNPTEPKAETNTAATEKSNTTADEAVAVARQNKIELGAGEMQKFAYELGLDPKKPLSEDQKKLIVNRKTLRELERALDSQKERVQYSKVLPWLKDDAEKIELLSIPSIEGRQVWINKNKIWSRAKSLQDYDEVVESQDIAMGMPAEYVKKSWGEPDYIETSGNPIYRNERWQYNRQVSTPQGYKSEKRFVYLEGGRVVGWETE